MFFSARFGISGLVSAAAFAVTMAAGTAKAVPTLQLDILGGTYNYATETIIAPGNVFTLLAIATPNGRSGTDILADTFFISAGIVPQAVESPSFDVGSFTINGVTIHATDAGMDFGRPPLDATANPLLPPHSVYDTYFHEFSFTFDAGLTTATYNTGEEGAGGTGFDAAGSGSYYVAFEIDISGLDSGVTIVFDLYDTRVKNNGDITLHNFAPFSHNAQSAPPTLLPPPVGDEDPIPEPATILVLLAGLIAAAGLRRRRAFT